MPENLSNETEVIGTLFKEMRQSVKTEPEKPKSPVKKFETLPDGEYVGRVYILTDTVANEKSPNYGRRKYNIQLTVTEGDSKGKMAYHHRILLPHYLANKPSEDAPNFKEWRTEAIKYMRQTDDILRNCGVETGDDDMDRFTRRIAENNRRQPLVAFTMRNGVPYIESWESLPSNATSDELFRTQTLPDGEDLPLN